MKKTLLTLSFAAIGLFAFAQKPAAGDKTAEAVLFLQTGTSPISYGLNNSLGTVPELRLRYFLASDMAARVRIGFGMSSATDKVSDGGITTPVIAEIKTSSGFALMLAPGIEKHFAGTAKLSPYVGAELPIGLVGGTTVDVSNANVASPTPFSVKTGETYKSVTGSKFMIGLNLVLGADYYVTDGLYVGGEMGLGIFQMGSTGEGTLDKTNGAGVALPQAKTQASSTFNLFGVYSTGGVRLGYKF